MFIVLFSVIQWSVDGRNDHNWLPLKGIINIFVFHRKHIHIIVCETQMS